MSREEDLIKRVYAGFNSRDMDGVLAALHADVIWANGIDGGHVHGRDGVRSYWTRQWQAIDPHVEPFEMSLNAVSKHLKVLEGAGLVERERQGREHLIAVRAAPLREVSEWVSEYERLWSTHLDRVEKYFKEKRKAK